MLSVRRRRKTQRMQKQAEARARRLVEEAGDARLQRLSSAPKLCAGRCQTAQAVHLWQGLASVVFRWS